MWASCLVLWCASVKTNPSPHTAILRATQREKLSPLADKAHQSCPSPGSRAPLPGRVWSTLGALGMGSTVFTASLLLAGCLVFGPAYLAEPSDAARLGYYAEDYEGNLCGTQSYLADGTRGRDLRARPFAYWVNATSAICVRTCPRLADELVCEYALEGTPGRVQRSELGSRCFAQRRTRASFPACLPHEPAASKPVDRWLSRHAIDQLAADTLQASSVILGCWCAAGLASLVVLAGLIGAPRLTLFVTMMLSLVIAFGGAALLLPHGSRMLAISRAPSERDEALYLREQVPGALQFALGWAACAAVGLLVLTLYGRARHAPLAAALLSTAARPLLSMPQLLLLPLYLFVAIGAPLASWITSVVFLATPCAPNEGCGASAAIARSSGRSPSRHRTGSPPPSPLGPTVPSAAPSRWYDNLQPAAAAADEEGRGRRRRRRRLPRSTRGRRRPARADDARAACPAPPALCPAVDPLAQRVAHPGRPLRRARRCGAAAAARVHLPHLRAAADPPAAPPRQPLLARLRGPPTGLHPPRVLAHAPRTRVACLPRAISPLAPSAARARRLAPPATPGGPPGASVESTPGGGASGSGGGGNGNGGEGDGFLAAGEKCVDLFAHSATHVASARDECHYFYALIKWTVGLGVALVGWLCLTNDDAPLLLSPLWPAAIILEGSLALASAIAVHEAALEAVLQSYCAEAWASTAAAAAARAAAAAAAATDAAHRRRRRRARLAPPRRAQPQQPARRALASATLTRSSHRTLRRTSSPRRMARLRRTGQCTPAYHHRRRKVTTPWRRFHRYRPAMAKYPWRPRRWRVRDRCVIQ